MRLWKGWGTLSVSAGRWVGNSPKIAVNMYHVPLFPQQAMVRRKHPGGESGVARKRHRDPMVEISVFDPEAAIL
jgi:hypothetical protein